MVEGGLIQNYEDIAILRKQFEKSQLSLEVRIMNLFEEAERIKREKKQKCIEVLSMSMPIGKNIVSEEKQMNGFRRIESQYYLKSEEGENESDDSSSDDQKSPIREKASQLKYENPVLISHDGRYSREQDGGIQSMELMHSQRKIKNIDLCELVEKRVSGMRLLFEDISTLPDQLIIEMTRCIENEIQMDLEQQQKIVQHRNELLFFNRRLMTLDSQHVRSQTKSQKSQKRNVIQKNMPSIRLITEELGEQQREEEEDGQEEESRQFCFISKNKETEIFEHLLELLKLFNEHAQYRYLIDDYLLTEGSLDCLLMHTVKLLHIVQISSLHILLNTLMRKQSAMSILEFVSYILTYPFYYLDLFDNQNKQTNAMNSKGNQLNNATTLPKQDGNQSTNNMRNVQSEAIDMKTIFLNSLFEIIRSLYPKNNDVDGQPIFEEGQCIHQDPIIFLVNIRGDSFRFEENDKQIQEILDIIHSVINECEVLSLLSKNRLDSLILDYWQLSRVYPLLSFHHLYLMVSKRMAKRIKFIISYQPHIDDTPKSTFYERNQSLFKSFTKYTLHNTHLRQQSPEENLATPQDHLSIYQSQTFNQTFSHNFLSSHIMSFKNSIISLTYSLELHVSQAFETHLYQTIHRTIQQTSSLFFLIYNIFTTLISISHLMHYLFKKGGRLESHKKQAALVYSCLSCLINNFSLKSTSVNWRMKSKFIMNRIQKLNSLFKLPQLCTKNLQIILTVIQIFFKSCHFFKGEEDSRNILSLSSTFIQINSKMFAKQILFIIQTSWMKFNSKTKNSNTFYRHQIHLLNPLLQHCRVE